MSKTSKINIASFMISCLAAVFFFVMFMLLAKNIGSVTIPAELFGYSRESGTLIFFGESFQLPAHFINSVIDYPVRASEFTLSFLPETVRLGVVRVLSVLWESFSVLWELICGAVLEFLRIGV